MKQKIGMKKFIILAGSVNGTNFNLASGMAYKTLDEAIKVRDQIIEADVKDLKTIWTEEDGCVIKVGSLSTDEKKTDKYDKFIDVFDGGDMVEGKIYKIAEVEVE